MRILLTIALLAGLGHTAHAQPIDIPLGDNGSSSSILQVEVSRGRYPSLRDRGEVVRELQLHLQNAGHNLSPDGVFGPQTLAAVRAFQSQHGLAPDGVVGPQTLRALLRNTPTQPQPPPTPTPPPSQPDPTPSSGTDGFTDVLGHDTGDALSRGASGNAVRDLQRELDRLGYPTSADGQFGPATERSLRAFQRDHDLPTTGALDAATRDAMRTATPRPTPPPSAARVTRRLSMGNLIVPEGYTPDADDLSLLIHFHGADSAVERELATSGYQTALLVVNIQGFSSAYRRPFSNASLFPRLLQEATQALGRARGIANPRLRTLSLSSFSAGYGAIREILRHGRDLSALRHVVLSDSLHASYAGGRPDPAQMAPFYAFAERAASNSNLRLVISHSSIVPGSYASTTETATAILQHVGARRTPVRETGRRNMQLTSRTQRGGILVLGYAGRVADDHIDQLQTIGDLFAALR